MKTVLFKGAAERGEREALLRAAAPALDIVKRVLEDKLEELTSNALSKKNYESPSWALLQADAIGEARGIQYAIELLTLDQEKE